MDKSEEGSLPGLGWIPGQACRFPKDPELKVPHMGWNTVKATNPSPLIKNLRQGTRYYFVHSYYVELKNPDHEILQGQYGVKFSAAIGYNNILGVQFHPEKSHRFGMAILKNFSDL